MKPIDYNGELKNPFTNEIIPCKIAARLRFNNAKATYINLKRLPKTSFIGIDVGRADKTPYYQQRCTPISAHIQQHPLILTDKTTNTKTPVYLVSCFYKGKDFCHVRVRVATDGLQFSEAVENRSLTMIERKERVKSGALNNLTIAGVLRTIRPGWRNGDLTRFLTSILEYRNYQTPLPDYSLKEYKEKFISNYGATEDEAEEITWFLNARLAYNEHSK